MKHLSSDILRHAIEHDMLPPDIEFRAAIANRDQYPQASVDDAVGAAFKLEGYSMPEWATQPDTEWPDCTLLYVDRPRKLVRETGVNYYTRVDLSDILRGNTELGYINPRHRSHPSKLSRAVWRRLIGHFSTEITDRILRAETHYEPGQVVPKKDAARWYIDNTIIRDPALYELFTENNEDFRRLMRGIGNKALWLIGGTLFLGGHEDMMPYAERLEDFAIAQEYDKW